MTTLADEYNDAAKIVDDNRKTTPEYVFLKFNCTDWAYKVGKAAGMKLPPAGATAPGLRPGARGQGDREAVA